jgi:hypothetical protein
MWRREKGEEKYGLETVGSIFLSVYFFSPSSYVNLFLILPFYTVKYLHTFSNTTE